MVHATARVRFAWRAAGYSNWNAQLLEYFLGKSRHGTVVVRIPATPEELPNAVADPTANAEEVVTAFVQAVRRELPPGKAFCSYCLRRGTWTTTSNDPPHFFGMLWFTCLLSAGYPESPGSFRERFRALIGTDDQCRHGKDQRGCLNGLWEELASWTASHDRYAALVLPPTDGHMVVIGRSYYLAFPTRRDRMVLGDVLTSADLLGFEPPIIPVVKAIEVARSRFSSDFRAALDRFLEQFHGGRDPTESAFWRAIRSEAAGGLLEEAEDVRTKGLTFVATWDDDETLLVRLASREANSPPPGMQVRQLYVPIDGATHYLTDESGHDDFAVESALAGRVQIPRGLASLIRQGVLVFVKDIAGDYKLAVGETIDGADLALVRAERSDAFRASFEGNSDDSRFEGWHEISDCRVHQLSRLPSGLAGVTQLLHTTSAPRPRVVDGIRVAGGYLWNAFFQPRIRSPAAVEMSCRIAGEWLPCSRDPESGDWNFPSNLGVVPPTTVEIRASYDVEFEGRTLLRRSTGTMRFAQRGHGCVYKPVGAGVYWREGCDPEQVGHEGADTVELGITTRDPSLSADLLELDATVRYLGPGLGEMSSEACDDHPWLAIGPKKAPHDLVFVGDIERPSLPDGGMTTNRGNRRVWSSVFRFAGTRVTARVGDEYVLVESEPRLRDIIHRYRRRASRQLEVGEHRACAAAEIDSCWVHEPAPGFVLAEPAMQAAEVMSALGVARSGVPLREVQELIARLTHRHDFLLWQHVIRAWTEAGTIDLLRRQDQSETMVVPRSPRFVMVRRGPGVESRLIGLVASEVLAAIRGLVGGGSLTWLMPTTPFQPPVLRLTGLDAVQIEELSKRIGLRPPEWLWWPIAREAPAHLAIREVPGGLVPGAPSDAYRFDARWDWNDMTFRLHSAKGDVDLVAVERRRHPQRCSIYVALVDGDAMLWCHLRSWALLRAAELWEKPPFHTSPKGSIRSRGFSPMHLPLPLGRLCTIIGRALPGPELGEDHRVNGYDYPFGARVDDVVRHLLPRFWLDDRSTED